MKILENVKAIIMVSDNAPDFSSLTSLIQTWGLAIFSAVLAMCSVLFIFFILKVALKIAHASAEGDIEARKASVQNLIWLIIGFALCAMASVLAGIFSDIFFAAAGN